MAIALQLIPILVPIVAPFITQLFTWLFSKLPPAAAPVINATLGAISSYAAGGNPATGALVAHVVRSGLVHEPTVRKV